MGNIESNVILDPNETNCLLGLKDRVAGTVRKQLTIRAPAFLSSIFVESIDPGASLQVNYYDTTTGSFPGERYDLAGHDLITSPGTYRVLVGENHNKPEIEAILAGGGAKYGVHITAYDQSALEAFFQNNGYLPIASQPPGTTKLYEGSVGTTSTPVPATTGKVIDEVSVRCAIDQQIKTRLEFSFDEVIWHRLQVGETREEVPRGGIKQIYIRAAGVLSSAKYEIAINFGNV